MGGETSIGPNLACGICMGGRRATMLLVLSSASAYGFDIAATKAKFRACALRADRGFAATPSLRSEVAQLVESLEGCTESDAAAPTASPATPSS